MEPITREEQFMAAAAQGKTDLTPITRQENFLSKIAEAVGGGGSGGMGGADWNAAEGEPGHILNRPFGMELVELISVENAQFADMGNGMCAYMVEKPFELINGENYTVKWDGVEFPCTAVVEDMGGGDMVHVLGNLILMGGDMTEEPFAYLYSPSDGFSLFVDITAMMSGVSESQHTFSVTGKTAKQIDALYLPMGGQVDWKQENNSAGYIKNKPFSEALLSTYEWDGDITDKKIIVVSTDERTGDKLCLCMVSDTMPDGYPRSYGYEFRDGNGTLCRAYTYEKIYRKTNEIFGGSFADSKSLDNWNCDFFISYASHVTPFGFTAERGVYFAYWEKPDGSRYNYTTKLDLIGTDALNQMYLPTEIYDILLVTNRIILRSTTSGSLKKFEITVDDSGTLKATEANF